MINYKIIKTSKESDIEELIFESDDFEEVDKKFLFMVNTEHCDITLLAEFGVKKMGFIKDHYQYDDAIIIKEFANGKLNIFNNNCIVITTGFERSNIDNDTLAKLINSNKIKDILTKIKLESGKEIVVV